MQPVPFRAEEHHIHGAPDTGRPSDGLDRLIVRERAWLDLNVLRLFAHPGFPLVFPEFLTQVYHAMHTAESVMNAALERSTQLATECPVAAALVPYWRKHIVEENGHDEWLLEDMRRLGIDVEDPSCRPPAPEVAELLGTLHFWILHCHPLAALGYFYFVERNAANEAMVEVMARSAGVDKAALRTFARHAVIDVEHGGELVEVVDGLPLRAYHRDLLEISTATVIRQMARRTVSLVARADELTRVSAGR